MGILKEILQETGDVCHFTLAISMPPLSIKRIRYKKRPTYLSILNLSKYFLSQPLDNKVFVFFNYKVKIPVRLMLSIL